MEHKTTADDKKRRPETWVQIDQLLTDAKRKLKGKDEKRF